MTGLDRLFHITRVTLCFSGDQPSRLRRKALPLVIVIRIRNC